MRLTVLISLAAGLSVAVPVAAQSSAPVLPALSTPVVEVAAFRVAPVARGPEDGRLKVVTIEDILSLPPPAAGGERAMETRVQAAETWGDVFRRLAATFDVPPPASQLTSQIRLLPQPQPGKFLRARAASTGLTEIEYVAKADEAYTIRINGDTLQVQARASDPRLIERMRADPAKASLFTATDAIGLPESVALQLTEIFAGEVDFHRELHQGYRCAIVYEAHYREGFIEQSGRILAAELQVGNRRFQAYYAPDTQGRAAYFDNTGKTVRRMFRRSPVEFTRITSEYTLARFHPILGIWRAHRGVDYAAPMGAKVMAVADGVVEFAGRRGDYGNLIILRHQNTFMTYYAHLNEFASGLVAGSIVEQGQPIGLVGVTGLTTGPHLHFEFHTKDASGNWSAVPAPDAIETTLLAAPGFPNLVKGYRDRLSLAESAHLVTLD